MKIHRKEHLLLGGLTNISFEKNYKSGHHAHFCTLTHTNYSVGSSRLKL